MKKKRTHSFKIYIKTNAGAIGGPIFVDAKDRSSAKAKAEKQCSKYLLKGWKITRITDLGPTL